MKKILVIPKRHFLEREGTNIYTLIEDYGVYLDRPYAETDSDFLQIIPYVVVHRNNKEVFAYTRLKKGAETRLHSNMSVGIGGHVDFSVGLGPYQNYLATIKKEINEELNIDRRTPTNIPIDDMEGPLHVIYDPTNEVGKVHLGILFKYNIANLPCSVRETEKIEGKFYPVEELKTIQNFENWSKIALNYLGLV